MNYETCIVIRDSLTEQCAYAQQTHNRVKVVIMNMHYVLCIMNYEL